MQTPRPFHWFLIAYLVLLWGGAFGLIAVALNVLHPVTIVWARLLCGGMVMAGVALVSGQSLRPKSGWWPKIAFLSVTGNLLPFTLIAWAEQTVPSGEVGMLMALMPITILLLSHYFLHQEPITGTRLFGVAIGFAGVVVLLGANFTVGGNKGLGQGAALLATIFYAINGIYTKRLPAFDAASLAAVSLLFGAAVLTLPMLVVQPAFAPAAHLNGLFATVILGVLGTGLASWAYFTVIAQVGPGFLSIINYLIPAFAFGVGVMLLDEPATWQQWLALAAIVTGVWLIQPRHPRA